MNQNLAHTDALTRLVFSVSTTSNKPAVRLRLEYIPNLLPHRVQVKTYQVRIGRQWLVLGHGTSIPASDRRVEALVLHISGLSYRDGSLSVVAWDEISKLAVRFTPRTSLMLFDELCNESHLRDGVQSRSVYTPLRLWLIVIIERDETMIRRGAFEVATRAWFVI